MTVVLAHRRAAGTVGTAPTELVEVDTTTGRVTSWRRPAPGRSLQRPVQSYQGVRAWYDLPAGMGTDPHPDQVTLVVDGRPIPRPERRSGWDLVRWGKQGHVEWLADGSLVHAVWEDRLWLGFFPRPTAWRCVVTGPDCTGAKVVTGDGTAEPSFHPVRGLSWAEVDSPVVHVGGRRIIAPDDQAFDPYVSPDGTRVVVLVRRGVRFGLWVVDLASGLGSWLVSPDEPGNVSHARWVDDTTVVCSRKTDSPLWWSLWLVGVDGSRRRLTTGDDGSVEQPFPIP